MSVQWPNELSWKKMEKIQITGVFYDQNSLVACKNNFLASTYTIHSVNFPKGKPKKVHVIFASCLADTGVSLTFSVGGQLVFTGGRNH